ncbi:MAG: PDZ domain-containing protein, partial [Pseudomonadota bacterium]
IMFTEPDAFIGPQGASRIALTERGRDLYIEIDVTPSTGEVPVKAELHVDTGFGQNLWLLTGKSEPFETPEDGELLSGVRGVEGAVSEANAPIEGRIATVSLGGETVSDVLTLFYRKGSTDRYMGRNGRIGAGLLNRFRYTFNLAEGALYLEPLSIDQPPDEWRYGFGAAPMQDGTYRVVRVTKDSAADEAGIQEGDILVSLGGNELAGRPYKDALEFLIPQEIKTVTACYRRDDDSACVEMTSRKTL